MHYSMYIMSPTANVRTEFRDIDFRDVEKVEEFCRRGCGCSLNCVAAFTQKHYLATRANAQQLERKELDMAVMGQVMAFTFCSQVPHNTLKYRHQVKQRERNASAFYHNSLRVCKRTFLFLHDIGDFRLKAIRAQYVAEGLVPRVHGHTGRVAPNALVLEEVKGIITFVMQYVETNAILAASQDTNGMTSSCSLPAAPNERCIRKVQPPSPSGQWRTQRSARCGGTSWGMLWSASPCPTSVRPAKKTVHRLSGLLTSPKRKNQRYEK